MQRPSIADLLQNAELICIDLDRTLWDFEANTNSALVSLYEEYQFGRWASGDASDFVAYYHHYNEQLWIEYEAGRITKPFLRTERFRLVLEAMGIPSRYAPPDLWEAFLYHCPRQSRLMPGAIQALEYLKTRYPLAIITNGFTATQKEKLVFSGLSDFFKTVVISEEVNCKKPDRDIFLTTCSVFGVAPKKALMIGDHKEMDVLGALNAGLSALWYRGIEKELEEKRATILPDWNDIQTHLL
jgi:putative hydrolase of the HAD superfamily